MTPSQELSTPTTDSTAEGYDLVQTPTSDVEDLFSLEEPDEAEDTIQLDAVLTDSDYVFEHTSGCSGGSSTQESHLSAMASHYVEVPLPVAEVSI
jgi:hypothetical protein